MKEVTLETTKDNKRMIPYGRQSIDAEDIQAVVDVLKGDYLTTGPKLAEFEKAIADYVGAEYAVAFSNGTAALHAACFAAGIQRGDEVITTPITFAASANCILYQGGRPVFADVDERTYNIDPDHIEKNISAKTKAIIPVDYTGQPADLDPILQMAKTYNLVVIEDAAHALGAEYRGKKIGSISDMTMFSFHPVKPITAGEGGVITTNHKDYYDKLVQFRTHGITRDRSKLHDDHGPWYYEMQVLGYNYRMTDIQAGLGLSQLKKLDRFITRRREIAAAYDEAFCDMPEMITPYESPHGRSGWHLYVLRLKLDKLKGTRRDVFETLWRGKIGVNVHYIPVYYHPYYQKLGYHKGMCPVAEKIYEEIMTLPLFPEMTDADVQYVIQTVKTVVKNFARQSF